MHVFRICTSPLHRVGESHVCGCTQHTASTDFRLRTDTSAEPQHKRARVETMLSSRLNVALRNGLSLNGVPAVA
eukprot:6198997-Pleurochrysis_carterae.AAC.2